MLSYFRKIILLFYFALLAGCGPAIVKEGDLNLAIVEAQGGNLSGATAKVVGKLKPDGNERLLYHLELGTINHLAGKYEESNRLFKQADGIADELYATSLSDRLSSMMTNPRMAAYGGTDFEKVYIYYYRALNYLRLAMGATEKRAQQALFENAQFEARQIDIKLTKYANEKGSYKEVKDKKASTFGQLLEIFNVFAGDGLDKDMLVFREDAYVRYLEGLIYELNGDYDDPSNGNHDNAIRSYQKAAKLYEAGYAEQYALDKLAQQAWFDAARIMKLSGGWDNELSQAEQKLTEAQRQRLKPLKRGSPETEVVIIQHVGAIPMRKELNFYCTANPLQRALILEPVLIGTEKDKQDQANWFSMLYAEKSPYALISSYYKNGLAGVIQSLTSKTFSLGPLWEVAEEIHLIEAIGSLGIRVTVPYYSPLKNTFKNSTVSVNGKDYPMIKAESLARIALQEQLKNAGSDLRDALARESLKSVMANETGKLGGEIGTLIGKIAVAATSGAETRNWRMLPSSIRIARIPVTPGKNEIILKTHRENRPDKIVSRTFDLKKGEVTIWNTRVIEN